MHRFAKITVLILLAASACAVRTTTSHESESGQSSSAIHVHPGEEIQSALDRAANDPAIDSVIVHEGTYEPPEHRQALIWFNARHNGIQLHAKGDVTLTAANNAVADPNRASYPAVVNHVVYFGEGIDQSTELSGFRIVGANNYVTTKRGPAIQPEVKESRLEKTAFFYTNGGGIKVFGASSPTLIRLTLEDNFSSPCGAAISLEQCGAMEHPVTIRNCIFRNNRSPLTGSAIDVQGHLSGSSVVVENCLFLGNLSNGELDERSRRLGTWKPNVGHGAVTVFRHSKAKFTRCTFVGNRNGVDDLSEASHYEDCIFWRNVADGGWPTGERYEIAVASPGNVKGCCLSSNSYSLDPSANMLQAPDPNFDDRMNPRSSVFKNAGYRAVNDSSANMEVDPVDHFAAATATHEEETLQLKIEGEEFTWKIIYPGDVIDAEEDIIVHRHLYVPVGAKVSLELRSNDFLYQLALPEQAVREIAVPGMTHYASFVASEPGVYPLIGDQFCGYAHPDLIGKLIVKDRVEFNQWLSKQK